MYIQGKIDLLSVQILLTTISMVNGIYVIACWYLGMDGKTLVEFMRREKGLINSTINNNIKIIFGTTSLWRAVLPSVRRLTHTGIHWPEIEQDLDPYEVSSIDIVS